MSTLSENLLEHIRPPDLLVRLAWLAELASTGLYVFIAYMVARQPGTAPSPELVAQLACIFTILAAAVIIPGIIFHHLFLSAKAVAKFADGKMPVWMRMVISQSAAGADKGKLASLPEDERNFYIYSRSAFKLFVLFYGFLNSCALLGMILAIVTRKPALALPFIGLSALLMLFYFPNLRKLIENARTLEEYQAD